MLRRGAVSLTRSLPGKSVSPFVMAAPLRAMSTHERPISPHVEIYKFPLPALTSITHRATGVALSAGVISMSMLGLTGSCDIPMYIHHFQEAAPLAVPLAKMVVAFPIIYHSLAGARHMYWDKTAENIEIGWGDLSSKVIIGAAGTLTLLAGFVTLDSK